MESVYSAIRAGVGVALINRKSAPTPSIEWDGANAMSPLPTVCYVARVALGKVSTLTAELATEIRNELTETPPAD